MNAGEFFAERGSGHSSHWCELDPSCDVNSDYDVTEYEYAETGNLSNDSVCSIPFCPNILSYSIKSTKYAVVRIPMTHLVHGESIDEIAILGCHGSNLWRSTSRGQFKSSHSVQCLLYYYTNRSSLISA